MIGQTYHGDITILPARLSLDDYKTAIDNPNLPLLTRYRDESIVHTWKYITRLKVAMTIEQTLQRIAYQLRVRCQAGAYHGSGVVGTGGQNGAVVGGGKGVMGISSLGSSAQLNIIAPPSTPTLCRIQSSTEKSMAHGHGGQLKSSTSANGINNINGSESPLPSSSSQQLQQPKTRTLVRRSSFFIQTYENGNNGDDGSQHGGQGSQQQQQSQQGRGVVPHPEEFRNTHDAPGDYYDPNCYLYEDTSTPGQSQSPGGVDAEADGAVIAAIAPGSHDDGVVEGAVVQPTSNNNTLPHSQSTKNSAATNATTATNTTTTTNDPTATPATMHHTQQHSHSSSQLKSRNSFYRIKSSFGHLDNNNQVSQPNIGLGVSSPPTTPSKFSSTLHQPQSPQQQQHQLLPPPQQMANHSSSSSILLPVTNSQYQPQYNYHPQQLYNAQGQPMTQNGTTIATIPRNLSQSSSISTSSHYQGAGDFQQHGVNYGGHNQPQQQQYQQQGGMMQQPFNSPLNHTQLYHSPSQDSLMYAELYPSNGDLAFEQF